MTSNAKVLALLQEQLDAELVAVRVYLGHGALARGLGLAKLAAHYAAEVQGERAHADELLDRILFLGGVPSVIGDASPGLGTTLDVAGANTREPDIWLKRDRAIETAAVEGYTVAARQARAEGDPGSALVFERLLLVEQEHLNEIEGVLMLVKLMGLPAWLQTQV